MIAAVDAAIAADEEGTKMTGEQRFSAFRDWTDEDVRGTFGGDDPRVHEGEAADRWGGTGAFRQSATRTGSYSKRDWAEVMAEGHAATQQMLAAFEAGAAASDVRAMDGAEAARRHIDRRFYDCDHEMHVQLAEAYVTDPRFTAHYEAYRDGFAAYVRDAIRANAARAAGAS